VQLSELGGGCCTHCPPWLRTCLLHVFLNGVQFFDEEEEIFDQVKKKFLTK